MEVEPVSYIFGSYNRRKTSHVHSHSAPSTTGNFEKKRVLEQSTNEARGNHAHSKSQPDTGNGGKSAENRIRHSLPSPLLPASCPLCSLVFLEPRVLDCLHTFCSRCLETLASKPQEVWVRREDLQIAGDVIHCPVCGEQTQLNRQGVKGLKPDYVVQHRLVLAKINEEGVKLLCDLCAGDVVAIERCTECLVNVCTVCSAVHRRHPRTAQHELLGIREVRRRGLMRIHRHLMCQAHPEHELVAYCTTCEQPACHACLGAHTTHPLSPCTAAAATRSQRLRRLLSRARGSANRDQALRRRLGVAKRQVQRRCDAVASEVEKYVEEYRRVIEVQRERLLTEIESIRCSLLSHLSSFESSLSCRLQSSSTAIGFSQALLEEGSDMELLTFAHQLLKKLEDLEQPAKISEDLKDVLKTPREHSHDGLVDFPPSKEEEKNYEAPKRSVKSLDIERKSILKENVRNSKNMTTINEMSEEKLNNKVEKRKSNLTEQKIEESSKFSILNQLKNCLESDKNNKNSCEINVNNSLKQNQIISKENCLISKENDPISKENHPTIPNSCTDDIKILEFLPQEPEICEGLIPLVFGQIRRITLPSNDSQNCCSASRPHRGGNPIHHSSNSKSCCGKSENRKSDSGKVYQITI